MIKRPDEGIPREFDRLTVSERLGATRLEVHVRPRSSRSAVLGVREGALDVAVTAPPADGEANAELVALLARALDVRKGAIRVVVGASSRNKLVEVGGLTADVVRARLGQAKR
jgi:uncharacterized protein (TIGR00251 family)